MAAVVAQITFTLQPEYQVPKPVHDGYAKLKKDPFGDLYDNPGMQVPPLLPTPAGYDIPKGAPTNPIHAPGELQKGHLS